MLPRINDAIAQLIRPIASSAQNNRPQPFERFSLPHKDESPSDGEKESSEERRDQAPAPDNVIPLRPAVAGSEKALSGLPLLGLLVSLSDSRKLLLGIGRRLYARMRKEQDKSRTRKGVILDLKA